MASAPQSVFLIRHGMREDFAKPEWVHTAERRFDPPLSDVGLRQAEDVGRAMRASGVAAIYASPFLRVLQTAAPLARALGVSIRIEPGLGEWLNPVWMKAQPKLLTFEERRRLFPEIDIGYAPVSASVFPEHDEGVEVKARVKRVLDAVLARDHGGAVALVTHASPVYQSLALLAPGIAPPEILMASITELARDGAAYRIVRNSVDHLSTVDGVHRIV